MSREIRITVDDDEVFERMKRRKQDLDLSWEDVLHRGLRRDTAPDSGREATRNRAADDAMDRPDQRPPSDTRRRSGREGGRRDRWDALAEDLESQIQNRVYDTIESSLSVGSESASDPGDFGDVSELERAEDATLEFDFLDDASEYRVPLRVNLRTGPEGIDVEVVAVRQGKTVTQANRFDGGARRQVNTRLASGDVAQLRFDAADETYAVRPVLTWTRDEAGGPTVSAVEIDEVVLDGDR
ncbi:hypothetical protein M0R88_11050 [Halorussus gelatinilyticus]|uniref:Uncharacterized protein n=1 Tax=Halorussus gelatinilyticus TaxID=2937524 RepID=A0A8U0IFJ9_9EURY|nr:hypothetical protein [Halorussus gelatinilyticus]UPV99063.1 hypothetical protein M0R88_11050 [Halorussus gelatinilyticus]